MFEMFLLYFVLSAISLEFINFGLNEDSFHEGFYMFLIENVNEAGVIGFIGSIKIYVLFVICSPIAIYMLLSEQSSRIN